MADYFISDLHLSENNKESYNLLKGFLSTIKDDLNNLYILGDLFDYWLGDDCEYGFNTDVLNLFKNINDNCCVCLLVGNRDFLLSKKLLKKYNIILIDDPYLIDYKNNKTLITHGDLFCLHDKNYAELRNKVRNKKWQQQFLSKPLIEREKFAKSLRDVSYDANQKKDNEILDVSENLINEFVKKYKINTIIHGHTHKPAKHTMKNYTRYVTSDWYTDKLSYCKVINGLISLQQYEVKQ
ncbi:MAG: UDP-2,3-diacylglucosamine diphosphatase [Gammaproteobacteria bacterium]|nr:MAG: UDP-2,3-diacylglucosamine diphosphatase [Gammaproteobacteria bacterium]